MLGFYLVLSATASQLITLWRAEGDLGAAQGWNEPALTSQPDVFKPVRATHLSM